MSKEMSVIALGVWVVVMPYLGIYRSWLTVLMVLTGIALMVIGFLLRGKTIVEEHKHHAAPPAKAPRRPRKSPVTYEESAPVVSHDYSGDHSTIGSLN
jgi:hypothetical protein